MSAWQLKVLLAAIFIGFSFFSWLFKQIAKKRAEAEQQRRIRAAQLQELRTGRVDDSFATPRDSMFGQSRLASSAAPALPPAAPQMDERQRKLAELRRRAAQRSGSPAPQTPRLPAGASAQVLAPQGTGSAPGVIVLPGGVTIRVNPPQGGPPQGGAPQGGQVVAAPPAGRSAGAQPSQPNRKQKQQNRPPRLTAEQQAQQQREQAMARQPVPRPPISRLPVSDTPDLSETNRLNADTDAPTVTPRGGRRSPVRKLASLSQRDLQTAFVLTQVFGRPKCME